MKPAHQDRILRPAVGLLAALAAWSALLVLTGEARAARLADGEPAPGRAGPAAAAGTAAATTSATTAGPVLHRVRLQAVDAARRELRVSGAATAQVLALDPAVRIVGAGGTASTDPGRLQAGQSLRVALADAPAGAVPRVLLVYVDAAR